MAQTRQGERPEESWQPARLIPTVGIKGQSDQELRATSSLLAVMVAVPDFGRDIVSRLGAPGGRIATFTEVRFVDDDGKSVRPDGAIVVERGARRWSCLIEVKTGQADLQRDQIEAYLDAARAYGFEGSLRSPTTSPPRPPSCRSPWTTARPKVWPSTICRGGES